MLVFPKTVKEFRRQAESGFRAANDAPDAAIEWTFGPKRVTFPTGLAGYSGVFTATADGFRPKVCVATGTTETGISVQ